MASRQATLHAACASWRQAVLALRHEREETIYIYLSLSLYIYIYIYIQYTCVYIYIYIYICMYTYISKQTVHLCIRLHPYGQFRLTYGIQSLSRHDSVHFPRHRTKTGACTTFNFSCPPRDHMLTRPTLAPPPTLARSLTSPQKSHAPCRVGRHQTYKVTINRNSGVRPKPTLIFKE